MQMQMTRRDAVIRMAVLMGATALGPRLLAGNFGATPGAPAGFTAAQLALLDEIADTIIPPTGVPGAKAAGVGAFIAMMLQDCYEADDQAMVRSGLAQLDADYAAKHQGPFAIGRAADRTTFLTELERARPKYFRILKELTLLGYFTSEIGSTQALQYAEVPGRYDGDLPYNKGERAWAPAIK
ncbi:MAG: hypothetical protein RL091_1590 [Verrucomicrobiota bacterium]